MTSYLTTLITSKFDLTSDYTNNLTSHDTYNTYKLISDYTLNTLNTINKLHFSFSYVCRLYSWNTRKSVSGPGHSISALEFQTELSLYHISLIPNIATYPHIRLHLYLHLASYHIDPKTHKSNLTSDSPHN